MRLLSARCEAVVSTTCPSRSPLSCAIRTAMGASTIDLERLTEAESLQCERYLLRELGGEIILTLSPQNMTAKKIVRMAGQMC